MEPSQPTTCTSAGRPPGPRPGAHVPRAAAHVPAGLPGTGVRLATLISVHERTAPGPHATPSGAESRVCSAAVSVVPTCSTMWKCVHDRCVSLRGHIGHSMRRGPAHVPPAWSPRRSSRHRRFVDALKHSLIDQTVHAPRRAHTHGLGMPASPVDNHPKCMPLTHARHAVTLVGPDSSGASP